MDDTRQTIALTYIARAAADRAAAARTLAFYSTLARSYGCSDEAVEHAAAAPATR